MSAIGIGETLPMVDHLRKVVERESHCIIDEQVNELRKRPRNSPVRVRCREPVRLRDTEQAIRQQVTRLGIRVDKPGKSVEAIRLA